MSPMQQYVPQGTAVLKRTHPLTMHFWGHKYSILQALVTLHARSRLYTFHDIEVKAMIPY
jgi:hypothetical protein